MTRLVVTADLHIDDYGSAIDAESGFNARFVDMLTTTRWVAQEARAADADALIVAGDYTERRTPAPPRVVRIVEALEAGPTRQIHVRGNHDSAVAGRSIVDILGGRPGWDGYTSPGISLVDDVAVCVIPYLSKRELRALPAFAAADQADVYRALREAYLDIARGAFVLAEQSDATSAILVGHQQLSGGRMSETQAAFLGDMDVLVDERALAAIGYAAVIFGHVHRGQTVVDDPACPVLFAGSVERVDWAEELEEKSYLVVDVEDGRATIERIPTPARRFVTLRPGDLFDTNVEGAIVRVLDLNPELDSAAVRQALDEAGAFDVQEIRRRPVAGPAVVGALSEGLSTHQALAAYFADDPDADAVVERGRGILEAAAS